MSAPADAVIQGVTVLLDYPEAQVVIPGSGNAASVKQSVMVLQSGAISQPNDLDSKLRETVASTNGVLATGSLFRVTFQVCQGATAPGPGDFTCTVEFTSDPFGNPVDGVTCSVSTP